MATRTEIVKVLKLLADAYPQRTFTNPPAFADTATIILKGSDPAALEKAALAWIAKNRFYPTLAELKLMAENIRHQDQNRPWLGLAQNRWIELMKRSEQMSPEDWSEADRSAFRVEMQRDPDWEHDDPNAPWMAWTLPAWAAWMKERQAVAQ